MKRMIIRALGACMTVIMTLGSRNSVAEVSQHVDFTRMNNGTVEGRYIIFKNAQGSASLNCDRFPTGTNDQYPSGYYKCTGDLSEAELLTCNYCDHCTTNKLAHGNGHPCGEDSRCDTTGMICEGTNPKYESGIFKMDTSLIPYLRGSYKFNGCEDGWYIKNLSTCNVGNTFAYNNWAGLMNCCAACSGLKDYDPSSGGSVTTFVNTTDTNTYNGYYWKAVGGSGITSCRGYLPSGSSSGSLPVPGTGSGAGSTPGYSDEKGTFTIEYCEYKS